ncbi:hypothetical protein RU01_21825 [Rhodococcus sp. MEB064]|nr:hypothetical protein RU01_21825 [Rhodococcus sp. MEB064]
MALEPYDRLLPLIDLIYPPEQNLSIDIRWVGQPTPHVHGRDRHERFLRDKEFDVAEIPLSSYLMYRQSRHDLVALPIFPRRMFSFSNIWVRTDSTASSWSDLRSGTVGVPAFHMALGVLARRDMRLAEGVEWRDITWASPIGNSSQITPHTAPLDTVDLHSALIDGEVDALALAHLPHDPEFMRSCRRLYGARAEHIERRILDDQGYVPIVHVLVARRTAVARHPELAQSLIAMFEEAGRITAARYNDPAWSLWFWGRQSVEMHRAANPSDLWAHGLDQNIRALRDFCDAATEQGMCSEVADLTELFE